LINDRCISFLALYFIVGIGINYYKYQARGLDMIPNLKFWKAIPGLVWDGIKYVPILFNRNNQKYNQV
jgi:hypothetical protein